MPFGWVLAAMLFLVAAMAGGSARADNWGSPMTVAAKPHGAIFADGGIDADASQKLEAFLDASKVAPGTESDRP